MHVLAPAKINLHLRVAPVNSDGFHPLQSWMCTVGLFDTLTFDVASNTPPNTPPDTPLALTCDDPSVPCDHSNLVMRAAAAIGSEDGGPIPGDTIRGDPSRGGPSPGGPNRGGPARGDSVRSGSISGSIRLKKEIPTGGGLGGGSSDAARTLAAINRLHGLGRSPAELAAIAATLGSDVAFFCYGPSSLCTGRGEIVRPLAPPRPRWVLLILPTLAVPTGPVYRRFDELLSADDRQQLIEAVSHEADYAAWSQLSAEALLSQLINDLERPAFDLHPQLGRLRIELEQFLVRIVRMSGSGSSLFTLYDDRLHAERAAATLNGSKRNGISLRVLTVPLAPEIDDDLR